MHPQDGRYDNGHPDAGRFDPRRPASPNQPDARRGDQRPPTGPQHRQAPPPPGMGRPGPAHGAPQRPPFRADQPRTEQRPAYDRDGSQTRAQPPGVLSGPGATANAAYSMMSDQRPAEPARGPHPSEAQTEVHDPYRPAEFIERESDSDADQESEAMSAAPRNSTNKLSVVALILSFLGITSVFGVICAYVSRRQIRESKEQGSSLATAALWIGWFYIFAAVLCLVVYFAIAGQGS
ncbi:DUF4190 domain-containing protein [Williamsia sp. Leaf354]|uniref:DUF4190 domain-containing protein n=1 Tax=Williamsia sp. Leaf354 TaxID=1736349 RepID=UPI000ACE9005|nr:DUF4190 domain-containing protein [Williamsia sp. Leaf354]